MNKILLTEDDHFLIDIYKTKLKEAGFSVEVVTCGEDCFSRLKEESFDLLILDIVLPGIDGWEILKRIKEKESDFKNLKILVLSNLGQKSEIEKAINLGADKYLIKASHTPSEVAKAVQELLK